MPSNTINPYAISFETIQNNLRVMIAQNQSTFTDFFDDASGSTVIDTAATLGAFVAFHAITQGREMSLEQATKYKSLIGNAYDKGYNVSRGKNIRLLLDVTPSNTGSRTAWTTIGSIEEYDVILMKDASFTKGIKTQIEVTIGNRGSEGKSISTEKPTLFRFASDNITDDARLFLNNKEVEYSTEISDLLNDKYLMISNSYGSVNVFYLNNGQNKYNPGDILAIDYIVRNNITASSISASEFYLTDFTVNSFTVAEEKTYIESKDSIRIGAALHAETAGLIKARADFKKVIQEKDTTIKSINDDEIQPGRIGITILKKNYEPLTADDKKRYNTLVANNSVTGVANLYYTDAHRYDLPIDVSLTPLDSVTTSSSLLPTVEEKVSSYDGEIAKSIDFNDIESYIEKEFKDSIKVARVTTESKPWEHRTYRFGDTCIANSFDGNAYYVAETRYLTGDIEPNWDSLEQGYVVDNNILWKKYNGDPEGIMVWKPHVNVKLGKLCVDKLDGEKRVWEAVGYVARTGTEEPSWSNEEQTIFDNEVVWTKINSGLATTTWGSNKLLLIGDTIEKTYDDNVEESYQDKTQYIYQGDLFGVFYTSQPLANQVECYSDETLQTSIGIASDIDFTNKIVTITPSEGGLSQTGSYNDLTTYHYLGGVTGNFYTKTVLANDVECFADSQFVKKIGTVSNLDISQLKLKILREGGVRKYYYRVADYAVTSDTAEPNWEERTSEGYIEDGARIRWKQTEYPVRFIAINNNTYAEFKPTIRMS